MNIETYNADFTLIQHMFLTLPCSCHVTGAMNTEMYNSHVALQSGILLCPFHLLPWLCGVECEMNTDTYSSALSPVVHVYIPVLILHFALLL